MKAAAAWSLGQIGMEAHGMRVSQVNGSGLDIGIVSIRSPSVADRLVSMCVLPVQTQNINIFET